MKVLIVSHLFPNRTEPLKGVFVLELARALARRMEVEVIAPVSWFPVARSCRDIPESDLMDGVQVHHPRYLALPFSLFGWRWRPYFRATQALVRAMKVPADIVHAHWVYPDAFAAWRWAKPMGMKTVVTLHGHAGAGFGLKRDKAVYHHAPLREADRIIAVSGELQQKLVNEVGVEAARIAVLHNGIDAGKFNTSAREAARRNLGIPLNKRVLLCVARLSEEKRLFTLIDAAARCRKHDWQLYILGEGPLKAQVLAKAAASGVENRIFLPGGVPHDRLRDWYCAADVFCLSSAHEGCPVVVHEALACGVPVVSTTVGAVPDLVSSAEFGLLCPPENTVALAEAIEQALSRTWDHERIAARGRQHTWDAVAERTMQIYEEALN